MTIKAVCGVALLMLVFGVSHPALAAILDSDADGLPDDLEQALLEKFVPTLFLSSTECDQLPAEFQPESRDPKIIARNGTIYGQAFKPALTKNTGELIELHYYTLWSRDCGRASHAFDAEHVSVLIESDAPDSPAASWKALYWYAAAHEDTLCDGGNAAKASAIDAVQAGAAVWVSKGKHAAFLSPELCRPGCGTDRCDHSTPMPQGKVVNIGEPGSPLNGAIWTGSNKWPLLSKMSSDFPKQVLAKLDRSNPTKANRLSGPPPPTKEVILTGNTMITGLEIGAQQTAGAVGIAGKNTNNAVGIALGHIGRSLQSAWSRVFRWSSKKK